MKTSNVLKRLTTKVFKLSIKVTNKINRLKNNVIVSFEEYVKKFVTKQVEITETGIKEIYRTKNKVYIKNIGYT